MLSNLDKGNQPKVLYQRNGWNNNDNHNISAIVATILGNTICPLLSLKINFF